MEAERDLTHTQDIFRDLKMLALKTKVILPQVKECSSQQKLEDARNRLSLTASPRMADTSILVQWISDIWPSEL